MIKPIDPALIRRKRQLFNRIESKGQFEQERKFLFPALYGGDAAVTRQTRGWHREFENRLIKLAKKYSHV